MENNEWRTLRTRGAAADPLVDFVLVAEFDIDTGSTLRHQYPTDIPGYKADFFAELMLPEGVHNREVDFNYIFLNRSSPHIDQHLWLYPDQEAKSATASKEKCLQQEPKQGSCESIDSKGYFLYGINMVKTKYDSSVRRGAIVKSMCIFSRYQFVESFKRPLELALENYFRAQSVNVLKDLFQMMNAIDLTDLPRPSFLECGMMRRGVVYDTVSQEQASDHQPSNWEEILMLNFFCFEEDGVEGGGGERSLSILGDGCSPADDSNSESQGIDDASASVTAIAIAPSDVQVQVKTGGGEGEKGGNGVAPLARPSASKLEKNSPLKNIPLKIPIYRTPDEVGNIYVTLLLKTFGEATMRIYHSILTQQRVLFVGYNHAASEVAQMVLSAVGMVAPPLTNIIRRTYPYANLSDLSFLEVPGYIAGVTNPMFQQRDSWWDLLCVLDLPRGVGHVFSAEEKRTRGDDFSKPSGSSSNNNSNSSSKSNLSGFSSRGNLVNGEDAPHVQLDKYFIAGVISGVNALIGEDWVRQQFHDHTNSILQLAIDKGTALNIKRLIPRTKRLLEANSSRIKALQLSSEFRDIPAHPWAWCEGSITGAAESTAGGDGGGDSGSRIGDDGGSTPATASSVLTGTETSATQEQGDSDGKLRSATLESMSGKSNRSGLSLLLATDKTAKHHGKGKRPKVSSKDTAAAAAVGSADSDDDDDDHDSDDDDDEMSLASSTVSVADENTLGILIRSYVRKLQHEQHLSAHAEVPLYFQLLEKYLRAEQYLQALLVMLPESQGGLHPIAVGLFHVHPGVRYSAALILKRISEYPSTRSTYLRLGTYYQAAMRRQLVKAQEGRLQVELQEYRRQSKNHAKLSDAAYEAQQQQQQHQSQSSTPRTMQSVESASGTSGNTAERGVSGGEGGGRGNTAAAASTTSSVTEKDDLEVVVQETIDGVATLGSMLQSAFSLVGAPDSEGNQNTGSINGNSISNRTARQFSGDMEDLNLFP